MFHFFERVNKGELKMVGKYQQLKIGRSLKYCHFIKIIKVLEIVSSLQHQAKNMLEIYAIRYTSI